MLLAFYKPYDVLSQFTREVETHRTLADYGFAPGVYGIGRLDRDSEGLLLLSDEGVWTDRLLNPKREHPRTYWAQVEGAMTGEAVKALREGVRMKEYRARPCEVRILGEEDPGAVLPPRVPPVRYRAGGDWGGGVAGAGAGAGGVAEVECGGGAAGDGVRADRYCRAWPLVSGANQMRIMPTK